MPLAARLRGRAAIGVGLCSALMPAAAQELHVLGGSQHTLDIDDRSYAFSFEYLHNLADHAFATFTWLNEGHVDNHHRDGGAVELWARWLSDSRRFALSGGIGPYHYYDTTTNADGSTTNDHGYGALLSAAAHWYVSHPWVLQIHYTRTQTSGSITTNALMLGVGYQFDADSRDGPVVPAVSHGFDSSGRNEVTGLWGMSIVNNFDSPQSTAWGIEYRRRLTPNVDATATVLNEGDAGAFRRHGLAGQLWLVRRFLDGARASVGVGAGPYIAREGDMAGATVRTLGLLTMSASYNLAEGWDSRLSWYRTLTSNRRDTDVIMLGLGYRF